ncbi:hypothetical protein D9756_009679 [Leucocoprinus leucothites]|uniref:Non-reducing end beta-L-arabinofuranosidase-like GH127 middle domain-containing protein n=1 Tax=Leucocoprinus leucothites TaxID=201217 RepID=A0A8H5CV12_9AGAR|nr:hypothetical protein D9756_009679 [Leucoagaricus leucothites]
MIFHSLCGFSLLSGVAAAGLAQLLAPKFDRAPTASVKPAGWALNQAQIQADGLAGHLRDFDSYVNGSIWVEGGSIEYSDMHEAAPYWFNGMVSLAFQLQDQRLIGQVRDFLDWTLDHQGSDGWLGPEAFVLNATIPRLVWPRYLILLGLIQYAEADPTQRTRILDSMHKFTDLVHTIWTTGQQGEPSMGFQFDYQFVRWEELIYSLQWLYDNDPRGKESTLLETMQLVRDTGFSWKNDWFTDAIFPKTAVPGNKLNMQTHGVNTAEALKSEALAWRFTGDPTDIQNTFDRIDMLYQFHGRASGTFSADEHIAGLDPSRGTELCAVVEQIFSLATIYQILGNNSLADRAEKLAYNALPAAIMPDWKSHQYDQQVNQIWAQVMDPPPWVNNGPNSNVFGFEPNYPCCTVNHPQAYPKFWANSFVVDQSDQSLVHTFLGPATFSGKVGSTQVKVTVDTLYPFGSTLEYTVTSTKGFPFKVRVPDWAQGSTKSTITVNGGKPSVLNPPSQTSLQVVQLKAGTSKITVNLNMPLEVETRTNGATTAPGLRSGQALGDVKRLFPNAPAQYLTPTDNHTQDNTLLPTVTWQLAIDPSTLTIQDSTKSLLAANGGKLPVQVWATGNQPITMTAKACEIEWGLKSNTAAAPPQSPAACIEGGSVNQVKLVPFAAAKLRLGEIPVMMTG